MAYCGRCNRNFPHPQALWQHEDDSNRHHLCYSCQEDFFTRDELREHWIDSPEHHYCEVCGDMCSSEDDLEDHQNYEHFPCDFCSAILQCVEELNDHNHERHTYCVPCRRSFGNRNNLNAHLNSSVHKAKDVHCPGANCGRSFVTMSDLMQHFEAGTCPSGMTRTQLNRMVVRADQNHVVTNPSRLIQGAGGSEYAVTETWATERSWNGNAYECFLCHGTFGSLSALNAHLKSPRHHERIYRCPNRNTCGVEFSTLSALSQHVESGKCGVNRFQEVKDAYDSLMGGARRIGM